MSGARLALAAALAAALAGCSAVGTYFADRGRDLTDVFDLRYGTGLGLGLQLDATMLFGAGLGYSDGSFTRTWYGRHRVDEDKSQFFGLVVVSELNSGLAMKDSSAGWNQMFGFNFAILGPAEWAGDKKWFAGETGTVPIIDTFRFGGVIFLPGVHGGLYLNVGELVDFLGGLFTFDLANDDGVPKCPPPTAPPAGA